MENYLQKNYGLFQSCEQLERYKNFGGKALGFMPWPQLQV